MDTEISMVQADSAPARVFTFVREDGSIADLTNASSVDFIIYRPDTEAQTNTGMTACVIQSPKTDGKAKYSWSSGDLPIAGVYRCLLRITYTDSTKETAIVNVTVESDTI